MTEQTIPPPTISIVSPVYNEEDNLQLFYEGLSKVLQSAYKNLVWELILVDDHSTDSSLEIIKKLSNQDSHVRFIRLAKNEGAHIAIAAGLTHAKGQCAIVLAADLQDPPKEIPRLIQHWRQQYQTVWLVRDPLVTEEGYRSSLFGKIWFWLASKLPGLSNMPPTGSDMFLLDRKVIDAIQNRNIRKAAIPLVIRSLGFRQINLLYTKRKRIHGSSGWTLYKKLRHVFNTVLTFTNFPIRLITTVGFTFSALSFSYSCFLIIHKFFVGEAVSGWHSLMVFNTFSFSILTLLIGMHGEYIWRIFENTKDTPTFLVEESSDDPTDSLHYGSLDS